MRLKALTLHYVLNIYIMGVGSLENFLRPRKGLGFTFFWLGPLILPKSRKFWESKKLMEQTFGEYQQILHGDDPKKEDVEPEEADRQDDT